MRLTTLTGFGLRTFLRIAREPGRMFVAAALASESGLSRNRLIKTAAILARAEMFPPAGAPAHAARNLP